ncbi:cytochrome b560 subunit of succinate dehydrogenase [Ascodesmis nigricans]|uniref:Cytochrome b560 subunit of succinate dehydrogenase n=1 Tax=Ascodesmis nigricans TaxID=341454 RepID=A0A4S2MJR5_9PEZI|nr:cytochrome b560 subunit of succinate dehydrogenase [Ascodesmis nigricans]
MFARSSLQTLRHPLPITPTARPHLPSTHRLLRFSSIHSTKASTIPQAESEAHDILVQQRRNRPIAPHLSIYQPQLTWYLSGLNRLTGITLSSLFYLYFLSYAAGPITGLVPSSAAVAATFAGMPLLVKGVTKMGLIFPFMFHGFNGIRHLVWDQAKALDLKNVYRTGYGVIAMTVVGSLYYLM